MYKQINRKAVARKRHQRIRNKISGTPACPRLAIYRSNKHIYAQLINDVDAVTLVSASTVEKDFNDSGANVDAARKVGELVAKRAKEKGVEQVVFDRGGNLYHGRIAALAEGAREGGLDF